jgi:hypothetical protein
MIRRGKYEQTPISQRSRKYPENLGQDYRGASAERFTQDYLETMLGFRGGNYRAIIPLLKRMEFLNADGSPTALYDQYRNEDTRSRALAIGIRKAYSDIFDRNEFVYALPREKLASLIVEMSGLEKESQVGKLMVSTFWTLKEGADFEKKGAAIKEPAIIENNDTSSAATSAPSGRSGYPVSRRLHDQPESS